MAKLVIFTLALALAAAAPSFAQPQAGAPEPRPMVEDGHFLMRGGPAIWGQLCSACHMADARGAAGAGAYPALAGNAHLASADYAIGVVVNGRKGMPAFGSLLDDTQVAEVVAYVRTHFGNAYAGPVTPAAVKTAR
jgi:mono/diheme cytochrome c family protein